jgi:molybdopterin synthase catalytic subunit
MIHVDLTHEAFDPHARLAAYDAAGADHGALASFVGYCRDRSHGRAVETLELQHYPGFTEQEIARMAEATLRRRDLKDVLVVHRVGLIQPGEAIVLVAARSAHRAAAFAAVEELMDFLKTDAPLWKREDGAGGPRWIEPTAEDRARRDARGEAQ